MMSSIEKKRELGRARYKKYYDNHRDKVLKIRKEYYEANREDICWKERVRYSANLEKKKALIK